jgi:hypothetical protein
MGPTDQKYQTSQASLLIGQEPVEKREPGKSVDNQHLQTKTHFPGLKISAIWANHSRVSAHVNCEARGKKERLPSRSLSESHCRDCPSLPFCPCSRWRNFLQTSRSRMLRC